LADCL